MPRGIPNYDDPWRPFKECQVCGQEYVAWRKTSTFCSNACRTAQRYEVHAPFIAEWRRLYLEGHSYKAIADQYGKVPNVIRGALQYHGVPPRTRWEKAHEALKLQRKEEQPRA